MQPGENENNVAKMKTKRQQRNGIFSNVAGGENRGSTRGAKAHQSAKAAASAYQPAVA
jgi:hypothetical protein